MPRFRFETIEFDHTTTVEEELASVDLFATPRAIERAHAALMGQIYHLGLRPRSRA